MQYCIAGADDLWRPQLRHRQGSGKFEGAKLLGMFRILDLGETSLIYVIYVRTTNCIVSPAFATLSQGSYSLDPLDVICKVLWC